MSRSADLDGEVWSFLRWWADATAGEFGIVPGGLPALEWGDVPQFRTDGDGGSPTIVVAREGADWWRIRYQIAHEVFHMLCGPRVFHWTHEFFAVDCSIRALKAIGEDEYARRGVEALEEAAALLPTEAMLVTPIADGYPSGLHARAFVTGCQLTAAVGWPLAKSLAHSFDPEGEPDLVGWLRSLPQAEQERAEAVLRAPSPAWV